MRAAASTAPPAVIQRACRAWQTEAVVIRGDLRRRGVHGALRTLDDAAGGHRLHSAPTQLTRLALEMRDAGCDAGEVRARLRGIADTIVALTFGLEGAERTNPAAGQG